MKDSNLGARDRRNDHWHEPAMIGKVARILPMSFVDGPGNRAVVFLQGCNFRCLYCHNPETIRSCTACVSCMPGCPAGALERVGGIRVVWDPSRCTECDHCLRVCPNFSQPKVRVMTPEALVQALEPARPFISGVTVTGGEPALQPEFLEVFLPLIRSRGLSALIDTNGSCAPEVLDGLIPHIDGALVDLKALDPEIHRDLTGADNARVLDNIRRLANRGKLSEVRTVVAPGYTDSPESIREIAAFLASIDRGIAFRLIRFRPLGVKGRAADWPVPADGLLDDLVHVAREAGVERVTRSL